MTIATIAIFLSVVMHVCWNLLARHVDGKCNFLWWALLTHTILFAPISVWAMFHYVAWTTTLTWLLLVTTIANAFYFLALRRAYHYAPVALVYPVARSSPLLIAAWSTLFLEVQFSFLAWAGIIVSVAGLWLIGYNSRKGDALHAWLWALVAALFTSFYSLSDKFAAGQLKEFLPMLGFISVSYFFTLLILTVQNYRATNSLLPACRPRLIYLVPGGLFIGTAYALVIYAMQFLAAAFVVAFTNSGIVLAVILSIFGFRESEHWRSRFTGAVVITLGLVILAIGR